MSNYFLNSPQKTERGATMIEFALGVIVFFTVVFGIIDFSRLVATQALLNRGAQEAVVYATKIEGLDSHPIANPDPQLLARARQAISDIATQLPINTIVNPERLHSYTVPDGLGGEVELRAILIRPGEQFNRQDTQGNSSVANHPSLCADSACLSGCVQTFAGAGCNALGEPQFNANYQRALLDHPLMVEMRANIFTFFPFFSDLEIVGRAFAYREIIQSGAFPLAPSAPRGLVDGDLIDPPLDPEDTPNPEDPTPLQPPGSSTPGEPPANPPPRIGCVQEVCESTQVRRTVQINGVDCGFCVVPE